MCLQDARRSQTLPAMVEPTGELSSPVTTANIVACLRKLGPHIAMFSEVAKLLELFLLLSVTSATAERSFSGLRRLKTFLRTRMSQELLNSLAILHVHKRMTREVDVLKAAKEFVGRSEHIEFRHSVQSPRCHLHSADAAQIINMTIALHLLSVSL